MGKIWVFEGGNIVYDEKVMTQDLKEIAVEVTELPPLPELEKGQRAQIRADIEKQEVYYEIVDAPIEKDEEIEELKNHIADLYELVLFGGEVE